MTESLDRKLPYLELHIDDRLSLRQLRLDEAETVFSVVDRNRAYLSQWLPWVEATKSPRDSEEFINEMISKRATASEYGYGIFVNGKFAGHTSLMHTADDQQPEIGYWVASEVAGQGVATKAAKALTDFGFEKLGLGKIVIKADPKNIASNKVAEKLGYKPGRQEHIGGIGLANVWEIERPQSQNMCTDS